MIKLSHTLNLSLLSVVTLVVSSACSHGKGASEDLTYADPSSLVRSPFATCSFFFRDEKQAGERTTTLTVEPGEPGDERIANASLGDFRVRLLELSEHPNVAGDVVVYVGAEGAAEDKWLAKTLFQLGPQNRAAANVFAGGHGFTGLHYVWNPATGSELQWSCSRAK